MHPFDTYVTMASTKARPFDTYVTMASTTGRWSSGRSPLRWLETWMSRRQRKGRE